MRAEVVLRVAAAAITCMFLVIVPATCQVVSFNLRQEQYSPFVQRVRNQVQDPRLQYHGIPMISPPNQRNLYFYVNLNARLANNQAFTIGLQLRRSDLYVLAYRDQVDGRTNRAFYFRGEIPDRDVFPNIANVQRLPMRVQFDYISLETVSGQPINTLQFGVASLESAMRNMYGRKDVSATNPFRRDQAKFLLITIHMVAEAARFKYIEKKGDFSLRSDYQVKSLVNNWGSLSVQIAISGPSGVFRNPVSLKVASNRDWIITNVNQIKPDMGLLKYERAILETLYFYINLNARLANNQAFTMGLQFRRSDLNLVAYRDLVDGRRNRAFFFRGEIPEADVFPNIANMQRLPMRVHFTYQSLEFAAGQLINTLQFGVDTLESEMRNIYGRKDEMYVNPFTRDQARFLLITIHMVSEAARFIYVERRGNFSWRSDYRVKSLGNNWGPLSVQIANSGESGMFRNPVYLQIASDRVWTITNVNQIRPDIALLRYERVLSDLNDNVVDDDDKLPRSSSLEDAQIGRAVAY